MEQSKAMEYESRKASSDVLKPLYIYIYIYNRDSSVGMETKMSTRLTEIMVHCGGNSRDFLFHIISRTAPGLGEF
jgi:hypothetical protein